MSLTEDSVPVSLLHLEPGRISTRSRPTSTSSYNTAPSSFFHADCDLVHNQLCNSFPDSNILSAGKASQSWLDSNTTHIFATIRELSQLNDSQKQDCIAAFGKVPIFQRIFVYTFTHLSLCEDSSSKLVDLLTRIDEWEKMNDVTLLLSHRQIKDTLWTALQGVSGRKCNTADALKSLLPQDVMAIGARAANALQDKESRTYLMSMRDEEAQVLTDLFHALLDYCDSDSELGNILFRALVRISKRSELYPTSLVLRDVELTSKFPLNAGQYGDIYMAKIRGRPVAVKLMRKFAKQDVEKLRKAFSREAVTWAHLSYPNVLPLYGIFLLNEGPERIGLVSPWMKNGTVVEYLAQNSTADRTMLLLDVALGLKYLHAIDVVHGDLKGSNILVTPTRRACLADFGLTTMKESQELGWTASNAQAGGTINWLAPELLVPLLGSECQNTRASDVYAFAFVGYEIFSGQTPFHAEPLPRIAVLVAAGQRPPRPSRFGNEGRAVDEDMWALLEDCWKQDPNSRPEVGAIVQRIRSSPPKSDWDEVFMREIRSDVKENPFHFAHEPSDAPQEISWSPSEDLDDSPGLDSHFGHRIPEIVLSPAIDNGNLKEMVYKPDSLSPDLKSNSHEQRSRSVSF